MTRILYVDCCIRGDESRTRRLAARLVDGLGGRPYLNVETVRLMECNLTPLNAGEVELRNRLVSEGCFDDQGRLDRRDAFRLSDPGREVSKGVLSDAWNRPFRFSGSRGA